MTQATAQLNPVVRGSVQLGLEKKTQHKFLLTIVPMGQTMTPSDAFCSQSIYEHLVLQNYAAIDTMVASDCLKVEICVKQHQSLFLSMSL